jgi:hypothetical protein
MVVVFCITAATVYSLAMFVDSMCHHKVGQAPFWFLVPVLLFFMLFSIREVLVGLLNFSVLVTIRIISTVAFSFFNGKRSRHFRIPTSHISTDKAENTLERRDKNTGNVIFRIKIQESNDASQLPASFGNTREFLCTPVPKRAQVEEPGQITSFPVARK